MKLIHLSDLHIGKRVNEISMIDDQKYILDKILEIIDDEKPQAILICGDVYDKSVPSAEAVCLFDKFLSHLAQQEIPVLIISGNHDSPERLSFGNRLLERAGVHISSVYEGKTESVTLTDDHGDVTFWLLPFIKPAHVKRFQEDKSIESYTDALRAAVEQMAVDPSRRNVLLTHQFVTGALPCESEELSVGGTDNVDASVFDDFDYVALGHIHGPQNVGDHRIRYCGTPLKYSLSEEHHHKSVTVVELGEKGQLEIQLRPLIPRRDLRTIQGPFAELISKTSYTGTNVEDYLHIVLTDEDDIPEAVGRLREIYPNLMKLSYDNTRTRNTQIVGGAQDVQYKSPLTLFEELYELQNNQPMTEQQRSYVRDLIESIEEGLL